MPGFLSVITGLDITLADAREGRSRRIARDTGLFVAGFSVVFILLGLTATTIGSAIFRNQALLTRISGLLVLAMAAYLLGLLIAKSPWLYQDKRFHPQLSRFGPFAAPVVGVAFGFGWTPCIVPSSRRFWRWRLLEAEPVRAPHCWPPIRRVSPFRFSSPGWPLGPGRVVRLGQAAYAWHHCGVCVVTGGVRGAPGVQPTDLDHIAAAKPPPGRRPGGIDLSGVRRPDRDTEVT